MNEAGIMGTKTKRTTKTQAKQTRRTADEPRATDLHGVRYVVNEAGERLEVVMPVAVYEQILDPLEDIDDVRAYDEAKRDGGDPVPLSEIRETLGI